MLKKEYVDEIIPTKEEIYEAVHLTYTAMGYNDKSDRFKRSIYKDHLRAIVAKREEAKIHA